MEIKTKFNVNDEVYFIHNNNIMKDIIIHVMVNVSEHKTLKGRTHTEIKYTIETDEDKVYRLEDQVFKTKQDILDSVK